MKKVLSATLVTCLLVLSPFVRMPLPAYADDTPSSATVTDSNTGYIRILDFVDIEQEIMAHNPVVQANQHLVDSTIYGFSVVTDNLDDLTSAKKTIDDTIGPLQTTLDNLTAQPSPTFPVSLLPAPSPPNPAPQLLGLSGADSNDNLLLTNEVTTVSLMYGNTIENLKANKDALDKQIKQLQSQQASLSGTVDQVVIQTTMANKQLVWAAQSMDAAYNKIISQKADLKNNLDLLHKQLNGVNLQISLGLATENDANSLEDKAGDLQLALDNLGAQAEALKGDLNVLLGQPYDTPLTLNPVPVPDMMKIQGVNFKADSDAALAASYQVQIAAKVRDTKQNVLDLDSDNYGSDSNECRQARADLDKEQVNLQDTKRKFGSTFSKAYEDLVGKQKALSNEQAKLGNASQAVAQGQARYDAGMISSLLLSGIQANYQSEQIKVQNLQNDVQMAYAKYLWMKQGLTL